jgi:tetratricopeptide (TPR) repeat protein
VSGGLTYLRLNPALAPALWGELSEVQRRPARAAWAEAMRGLVDFLYAQQSKDPALAACLTLLELPNLVAALAWRYEAALAGDPGPSEAAPTCADVADMVTSLEGLLQNLGRPRVLAHVARVRAAAAQRLGWSHARFEAERAAVERLQDAGRRAEAVTATQTLLSQAQTAGPEAYQEAAYDLALAHLLLGRMLQRRGDAEAALAALADARTRFTRLAEAGNADAARMAAVCLVDSGDCLRDLGRLDAAATAYEETIRLAEQRNDPREAAVNKGQLGTVRLLQGDYPAALAAWTATRDTFAQLGEPGSVAVAWHQIGRVHQAAGQYAAAEHAYQESLWLKTQIGDTARQGSTLIQLGSLYAAMDRLEDAVRFSLQAADLYATLHDLAGEGRARNNAAIWLIALRRYDAARRELQRASVYKEPFGHATELWKAFSVLHDLERAVGNPAAATAARQRAHDAYLAYRRAGGVSQSPLAKLYALVARPSPPPSPPRPLRLWPPWPRSPTCPPAFPPSSAPCRPSSPAPVTPPWPTTRTCFTWTPPNCACCWSNSVPPDLACRRASARAARGAAWGPCPGPSYHCIAWWPWALAFSCLAPAEVSSWAYTLVPCPWRVHSSFPPVCTPGHAGPIISIDVRGESYDPA